MFFNFSSTVWYENIHQFHSLAHRWDPEKNGIAYIMAGMGHVPYANYLYDLLKSGSKVGNFVEIKKSTARMYLSALRVLYIYYVLLGGDAFTNVVYQLYILMIPFSLFYTPKFKK